MTTRTISEYIDLLPSASGDKANFTALLAALLDGLVDGRNCVLGMPDAFDIDNATGAQLDAVGARIGLSRLLPVPITGVYFSLDTVGVGLDEGVLRGPFDPLDALTSLDDETYRLVLKVKVRANSWDGSLAQAQQMLGTIAPAGTLLFMQDNFNMSAAIGVSGKVPSKLFVSLLKQMRGWIKPAAVGLPAVYVTSATDAPVFGLDVQNAYIGGLDTGALALKY